MTAGGKRARTNRDLAAVSLVVFDFDGVFTDNTVWVTQDGVESVRCWRSDGLGLSRLKAAGVPIVIVSTEANPVVSARARKLALPVQQGVEDKGEAVRRICAERGVDAGTVMYVGNDINDISAFQQVGIPVAVADAHPAISKHVVLRTKKPGGFGAVREVCDWIVDARQKRPARKRA
jgi:3-deoxy-D-manno-octulosonate 8-phosphate phosphatase (KDO 8-P phosphatase)